ncbi:type IV pilus assembly protein PilA [Microbacterium sp. SORGH_AS 505]|uniref:type IV pilin protein n=1 Tax=Microbacterium sp. SORGH_AS_0505 TaxID=3041770 RepID=UPI002785E391|nr:type II secretion system protein [Microbacterium sp. SORGH_AS_0505]MDQ1125779.1 type IV pilus assembly protein PilA [Microbacterium sp. SORGH_AS_0505]
MRASLKNYMAACNRRKEETGESGFSLIELIVVVVILGILAAIAVPVFTGLQAQSEDSARATVAANAATQAAAALAKEPTKTVAEADFNNLKNGSKYSFTIKDGNDLGKFCVTVTETNKTATALAGPGCTAATGTTTAG